MTALIDLRSSLEPAAQVLCSELDGEALLLDQQSGTYYGLDEVGARIWALLGEEPRLEAVFERLLEEYQVEPEALRGDLLAFVRDLAGRGLLRLRSPEG